MHRVVRERKLHAPRLDLGEVEHVVDEPQKVLAARLHLRERRLHVARHLAVHVTEDHLVEAEQQLSGVLSQAHDREELRLVLARDLELPALLGDLAEQSGVLDRERGLRGESLEEIHYFRGKRSGRVFRCTPSAPTMCSSYQWHREQRSPGFDDQVPEPLCVLRPVSRGLESVRGRTAVRQLRRRLSESARYQNLENSR